MKKSLIFSLGFLTFNAFAAEIPNQPAACPSVVAIQQVPLVHATYEPQGFVVYGDVNAYGTKDTWEVRMYYFIRSGSQQEALQEAGTILMALTGEPTLQVEGNMWVCRYPSNSPGLNIVAVPRG